MIQQCTTLNQPVTFEGIGIHTGQESKVKVCPAEAGQGLVFVREGQRIPALANKVTRCPRCTILGENGIEVSTVEHLLASLYGVGVTDALIEVSGLEIPILDGSSKLFCESFQQVGLSTLDKEVRWVHLSRPMVVREGEDFILALPANKPSYTYLLDYEHPVLGFQEAIFYEEPGAFESELQGARTFALWEEVQALLDSGMALGGSLDNALVVHPDAYSVPLRYPNEPARHKCLDLYGDLVLIGRPLCAKVIALRSGHKLHTDLAKRILSEVVGSEL